MGDETGESGAEGEAEADAPPPEGTPAGPGELIEQLACEAQACRGSLMGCAYEILHDEHLAEEAVQEALLRALSAPDRLRAAPVPLAYLRGIVRNVALSQVRRARSLSLDLLVEHDPEAEPASGAAAVEVEYAQDQLLNAVRAAIERLPSSQREAVARVYLERLSLEEVADALGISRESVRRAISRALARLREWSREW